MKIRLYFSLLALVAAVACFGRLVWIVYMIARYTLPGGGSAVPFVPRIVTFACLAIVLSVAGCVELREWAVRRAADKSLRTNKTIDRLYIRFGGPWLWRLDGSPWHGLKKFDAWTMRNILLASRPTSSFAQLFDVWPECAEMIAAKAYECTSKKKIYSTACDMGATASFGVNSLAVQLLFVAAVDEAIEIYTPKILPEPPKEKPAPPRKMRLVWAWDCESDYVYSPEKCPRCGRQRLILRNNGSHLCEKCDFSPELNRVIGDEEQEEVDPS